MVEASQREQLRQVTEHVFVHCRRVAGAVEEANEMGSAISSRLFGVRALPRRVFVITLVASIAGQLLGALQGWPLWGLVLASMIPWIPLMTSEIAWSYRHYHWLALFYVLVATQGGHVVEHLTQMVQIHVLGRPPPESHGIFGALDIEWVHFVWNSWVLVAIALLLTRFRRNAWLWVTLGAAVWHEAEHVYIMSVYLRSGTAGDPGLLATGGAIAGGLPLIRPDLHFLYNVVETVPLVIAFVVQLKRTYNEWLMKALPSLSQDLLIQTTERLATRRFPAGAVVVRQGDVADSFYILVTGECEVIRNEEDRERVVKTMKPGEFFGEIGLLAGSRRSASVRAKTPVEVLALDGQGFHQMVERSQVTAVDLERVARERLHVLEHE